MSAPVISLLATFRESCGPHANPHPALLSSWYTQVTRRFKQNPQLGRLLSHFVFRRRHFSQALAPRDLTTGTLEPAPWRAARSSLAMNGADVGRARDRSRRHYCQCGGEREQGEFMCRRCSPNGDVPSLSSWRLVGALAYWLANHIRGVSERTG